VNDEVPPEYSDEAKLGMFILLICGYKLLKNQREEKKST